MTPEKWEQVKENIDRQFTIEDQGREDLFVETGDGPVKSGEAEFVVFDGPLGKMKLQFGEKPKLEDKKYHYSHRAGTAAQVEYKFSETETVHTFAVFTWDDNADEWKEIDAKGFDL